MKKYENTNRQEQARATKQRLFDAAYALLIEKSFKDISINEIVKRAGVSIGTFYLYYPTKIDVYYQTYIIADEYFLKTVSPLVQKGTTCERLQTFFDKYALYNSDLTSIKLTKLLYNGDNKSFLRKDDGIYSVLYEIVQNGLLVNELDKSMTAEDIVAFIMNFERGRTYDWCINDGNYNLQQATQKDISLLYKAIKA